MRERERERERVGGKRQDIAGRDRGREGSRGGGGGSRIELKGEESRMETV